jgi:hypothetical protein
MVSRDVLEYSIVNSKLFHGLTNILENRVSTTAGGYRASTTQGGARPLPPATQDILDRTGTAPAGAKRAMAPSWRKSKAEVVDGKVEKLFEAYKAIDAKNEEMARQGINTEVVDPA